jgi:hypothetical protein
MATLATGFPERLVVTVPDTVPELVPGGPAEPVSPPPPPPPQPKKRKAIDISTKLSKRYLDNSDKDRRFILFSSLLIKNKSFQGNEERLKPPLYYSAP